MKKLFTAVAISALALTWSAPMVRAAESATQIHKVANPQLHQVVVKKKAKAKSTKKKTTKTSQVGGARLV